MNKLWILLFGIFLLSFQSDNLPDVLIIGDSISIGYTPYVKKALEGKAHVVHNPGNAGDTGRGLKRLDNWLGDTQWDVIHFNWGLWDLCYRHPDSEVYGNRDKVNGTVTFSPREYGENLEKLVIQLKKTGSKLIFATTTYVPRGEAGRKFGDDKRYNKVAVKVMKEHGIQINRLNKISRKIHRKHAKAEDDVHFTDKGYQQLAKPVVDVIRENLRN